MLLTSLIYIFSIQKYSQFRLVVVMIPLDLQLQRGLQLLHVFVTRNHHSSYPFCLFLLPGSPTQRTYIFTFLLSSRVFIHPHELLAKVGQICLKQKQQLESGVEADKVCDKAFQWFEQQGVFFFTSLKSL